MEVNVFCITNVSKDFGKKNFLQSMMFGKRHLQTSLTSNDGKTFKRRRESFGSVFALTKRNLAGLSKK